MSDKIFYITSNLPAEILTKIDTRIGFPWGMGASDLPKGIAIEALAEISTEYPEDVFSVSYMTNNKTLCLVGVQDGTVLYDAPYIPDYNHGFAKICQSSKERKLEAEELARKEKDANREGAINWYF